MNRFRLRLAPVLGVLVCAATGAIGAPNIRVHLPDAPTRFLYDEAGVLSAGERSSIENELMALDRAGLEIGVAVFRSMHGEVIEDVSLALAEKWKPGSAADDNGALIVVALAERKIRIEVGYGLEPRITDAVAGRIIRQDIAPAFREGRYGDGILRAVKSVARVAGGQPLPESSDGIPWWMPLILLIVILGVIPLLLRSRQGTLSRRGYTGGGYRPNPFFGGAVGGGGGGGFGGGSFGGGSFGGGGASGSW